jgi:hypothetical protein
MADKKIIMEHNGETKEISSEKLNEMKSNPDHQVEVTKEDQSETRVKVKDRIYD